MRKTIYDIASMTTIKEIIDERVFKDLNLSDLRMKYNVPANSYISNFIIKHSKTDPPFEGYDPLGRAKVEYLLKDNTLTFNDIAMRLGVTSKGLKAYCRIYKIEVRKASKEHVNKFRASGYTFTEIRDYFGYANGSPQSIFTKTQDNEAYLLTDEEKINRIETYEKRIITLENQIEACKRRIEKLKKSMEQEADS